MAAWAVLTLGAPEPDAAALSGHGPLRFGRVDGARLLAVARQVDTLRPPPGLLPRGAPAVGPLVEELEAALLGSASMVEIRVALAHLAGREEPERPVLVVDARGPLAGVPWELLDGRFHVTRAPAWAGPTSRTPTRGPLQVVSWVADPSDPAAARVVAAAGPVLPLEGAPTPMPGQARALLVVAHGEADGERVQALLSGDSSADADALARWLTPALASCSLVVLCMCHGARRAGAPAGVLAARGVPVVAPRSTLGVEAGGEFVAGFFGSLRDGSTLRVAMAEGRRRILALARPVPDAWWWSMALYADGPSAASDAAIVPAPAVDGWPRGDAEAERVLATAVGLARGWLGAEVLARALEQVAGLSAVWDRLGRFALIMDPGQHQGTTPLVARMARRLTPGFRVSDLYASLSAELPFAHEAREANIRRTGDTAVTETLREESAEPTPRGDVVLEVLTGPEGGRRIALMAGETLGRADVPARATHVLYADGPCDALLSRCHVRCAGPGRLEANATMLVEPEPGRAGRFVAGEGVSLAPGVTIRLGRTWFYVLPPTA